MLDVPENRGLDLSLLEPVRHPVRVDERHGGRVPLFRRRLLHGERSGLRRASALTSLPSPK